MKLILKTINLFILASIIISCNGQVANEKPKFKKEKVTTTVKIPVPINGFSSAIIDHEGDLWFSSNGGGVYTYDGTSFTNYTTKDGLSSNEVFSIASDLKGDLWFGTQNGLTKYSSNHFEHIPIPYQDTTSGWIGKVYPVLNPNAVHTLATDDQGILWIGTGGAGAFKYDGQQFTPYLTDIGRKQEDSLYHNWIPYISTDNNGNMWFASMTHGGVTRFDTKEFTQFLPEDGLSDTQVRTIYCDRAGKIWIGFNGNRTSGLTVYTDGNFKTYSLEDCLCNQRIRSFYEDKEGNLWMGAQFGNLCIFDGQDFKEFIYEGQTFSDVMFIISDAADNIWFGGTHGIWKYDGKKLSQLTLDS